MSEEEIGFDPTRTGDPLIGATLGEYVVRSRMGVGGMGVVYRGEQPLLGKPVAIKIIRPEYSDDANLAKKFLDEARAVNAARHPNIIDVYSFGATPTGQQYLVMELLDGEPLDVYLQNEGGKLPIEEALALLKQVAAGLQSAHEAGVIHRDLKPPNLFLVRLPDGSRFLKLLDFGLAKRATADGTARPTANVVVGTPLYMAPEQVDAGLVSPATDLYALGCIAYELVVGKPPFFANSVLQLLELQKSGVAERVRVDGVPEEYFDLVFELLRKDMRERPQTAAEVKQRLEAIERMVLPPPTQVALQRPTRIQPPPPPPVRDTNESLVPPTSPSLPALQPAPRWPYAVAAAVLLPAALLTAFAVREALAPAPAAAVPEPVSMRASVPDDAAAEVHPTPAAPEPKPVPPAPERKTPLRPIAPAHDRHAAVTPEECRHRYELLRSRARTASPNLARFTAEVERRLNSLGPGECEAVLKQLDGYLREESK